MKPIIVKDQVRLGPGRCLQLALTGMGYRMFRSMITVAILALAVAFLVHMVTHALLSHRVVGLAYNELGSQREAGRWVSRLTSADTQALVVGQLTTGDKAALQEYERWSGADEKQMTQAAEDAKGLQDLAAYFEELPETARVVLTGGRDMLALVKGLTDADQYRLFMERLPALKAPIPLESQQAFDELIQVRMPRLIELVEKVREGHHRALRQVRGSFDQRTPLLLLADPPGELEKVLSEQGFVVSEGGLGSLSAVAQAGIDREHLARLVQPREVRDVIARRLGRPVALVNQAVVFEWVTNLDRAQWVAGVIKDKTGDSKLSAERILALAQTQRRIDHLQTVVGEQVPGPGGFTALPTATFWLIGLSFMVCVVGVANAMLMSVTERFAEIATMKCLGAMDTFVMLMFLFEAKLQGFFGGIVGLVLGLALAVVRVWVEAGNLVWPALDVFPQLMIGAAVSLVVGVILAGLAAVWPAWVASRLAPMEAMRVE